MFWKLGIFSFCCLQTFYSIIYLSSENIIFSNWTSRETDTWNIRLGGFVGETLWFALCLLLETYGWSGGPQTSFCHSQAVSKHTVGPIILSSLSSKGKEGEEYVSTCVVSMRVGECRNNICCFCFALRWLNDDMGLFLLLGRVTF